MTEHLDLMFSFTHTDRCSLLYYALRQLWVKCLARGHVQVLLLLLLPPAGCLLAAHPATLPPRLPTGGAAVLPVPGHPTWRAAGVGVALAADGSWLVDVGAEHSVNHLPICLPPAAEPGVLFPSSAGFGAVRPLLKRPLVEDGVLLQQVGLQRGP